MMIKCKMLQKWFNLSDPMLEDILLDSFPFRRFVGLPPMTDSRDKRPASQGGDEEIRCPPCRAFSDELPSGPILECCGSAGRKRENE